MQKAIITGGAFYNQNFFKVCNNKFGKIFSHRIYLPELQDTNIMNFDYIVIASRLNADILHKNAKKFEEYLKHGGNIVSFGDVTKPYLPNINFTSSQVNFWWWINQGADLPMYAYDTSHNIWNFLAIHECKWHYHGTYSVGATCEKILVDEIGRSILYKDANSFKGTLYVTSLDPDFHIGQGFMPVTIPFLEKFLTWVEVDIKDKL